MSYRHLLFDLDGTLTDSKEGILASVRYACEKLKLPLPGEKELLTFIGPPLVDSFTRHCGTDAATAEEAVRVYREFYRPKGQYMNVPAPGITDVLAALKRAGRHMALASSKPEVMCREICERFGFAPYLEEIVGSKPPADMHKAAVIRDAIERLGWEEIPKDEILMIGDRKYDVLGAAEVGLNCLGVEFFDYAAPGELEEAGAVAVVGTPQEMEAWILAH